MPLKPDGYTIFCDDIRQEVGSKSSLMGIYQAHLFVHQSFPATLPRMGFYVVFREDPQGPLQNMTLCIYLPGDSDDMPSYKAEIERSANTIPPPPPDLDPSARRTFILNVLLHPITFKEAGKVKVRMLVEDEVVKLGTLNVAQAESNEAAQATMLVKTA